MGDYVLQRAPGQRYGIQLDDDSIILHFGDALPSLVNGLSDLKIQITEHVDFAFVPDLAVNIEQFRMQKIRQELLNNPSLVASIGFRD